jgi:SAM-dependent methyltransferase
MASAASERPPLPSGLIVNNAGAMSIKKALKPYIPPRVSAFPYVLAWRVRSWWRRDVRPNPLDPPWEVGAPGEGDLKKIGSDFVDLFRTLGGLRPDHRVLEVGCGVGRMALPLTGYLAPPGGYEGVDVVRASIRWCRAAIGRRAKHFRFTHADIFNGEYNPRGTIAAEQYTFPFRDGAFDFVFLTSVFTHMLPPSVRRYLDEIRRVVKPGGRVLATFFLIPAGPSAGGSWIGHEGPGYRTSNPDRPEEAIAYEESVVREWFRASGLSIVEPVHRGSWTNFEHGITYQDVIVAVRE